MPGVAEQAPVRGWPTRIVITRLKRTRGLSNNGGNAPPEPWLLDQRGRSVARWNLAAYVGVALALVLMLAITIWGAYRDFADVRSAALQGEINRLRSHAVRTVGRIQDVLGREGATLAGLRDDPFLRDHWATTVYKDPSRLYAAIVDQANMIVMHSDPSREGAELDPGWYDHVVKEAGDDVVETHDAELSPGGESYDIRVPIFSHSRQVGTYHSGFNTRWFEESLAQKNRRTWTRWGGILAFMLLVVVAAAASLFQIVKRTILLRQAVELARVRQFAELGQLVAGIAHEIRNPLNAIRLNLHVLERMQQAGGQPSAGSDEATAIIAETNNEIERVEDLMKILLGYARPEKANNEDINVAVELQGLLNFLQPVMERARVKVAAALGSEPAFVNIDRNRFRQVMLNLLNNAKEAVGEQGRIEVRVERRRGRVEVLVDDDGPGVPEGDRERIFNPFFSTKELGTGLGLALVRRFVEEVGGGVACEASPLGGARFRLIMAEVVPASEPVAVEA